MPGKVQPARQHNRFARSLSIRGAARQKLRSKEPEVPNGTVPTRLDKSRAPTYNDRYTAGSVPRFGAFMNFFKLWLSFSIALSGFAWFQSHSVHGAPVAERFFRFDAVDLQGQNHLLSQYDSQKARVFVFLLTSYPIANSYTQELNRLGSLDK